MVNVKNYIVVFVAIFVLFIVAFSQLFGFATTITATIVFISLFIAHRVNVNTCERNKSKPVKTCRPIEEKIVYYLPKKEEALKEEFVDTIGFLPHFLTSEQYNNEFKQHQHCYEPNKTEFEQFQENDKIVFEQDLKFKYKLRDSYKKG